MLSLIRLVRNVLTISALLRGVVPNEFFTVEGDSVLESLDLTVKVTRSARDGELSVSVLVAKGVADTADVGTDFTSSTITLVFVDQEESRWADIQITDDNIIEDDETFTIMVGAPGYSLAFVTVTIKDDDGPVPFDCNRFGVSCQNGGSCSPNSTTCRCTSDYEGYNCGVRGDQVIATSNCDGCSGKGLCVVGDVCACTDPTSYSGAQGSCELDRIAVTSCVDQKMTIVMNPEVVDISVPLIRVAGTTDAACQLSTDNLSNEDADRVPADDGYTGQSLTVDFNRDCGTHEPEVSNANPDISCYTVQFTINYKSNFLAHNDELVLATCCVNTNGNVTTDTAVNITYVSTSFDKQFPTKKFEGASVVPYHVSGLEVTTPLAMDEMYYLDLTLLLDDYVKLNVERMWCTNGLPDPGDHTVEVFKDGCEESDASNFIARYPRRMDDTNWRTELYPAFWINSPPQMKCFFAIRMCLAEDTAACADDVCDSGRKRRQADTSREETVDAVVTFRDPATPTTDDTTDNVCVEKVTDIKECSVVSQEVFPAFAAVSVLAMVLLILSICLCLALCCSRRRRKDKKAANRVGDHPHHASSKRQSTKRRTPSSVYTHERPY